MTLSGISLNPNGDCPDARILRPGMIKGSDFLPVPAAGEPPQVTRFAPSPTGYLHLGHAYSALFGYEAARYSGGRSCCALRTSIDSAVGRSSSTASTRT